MVKIPHLGNSFTTNKQTLLSNNNAAPIANAKKGDSVNNWLKRCPRRAASSAVIPGVVPGTHPSPCSERDIGASRAFADFGTEFAGRWVPGTKPRMTALLRRRGLPVRRALVLPVADEVVD